MRLTRIITVLIGLALLAAACTGNNSGEDFADITTTSASTPTTDDPTTTTSSTTTTEAPPDTRPTQTVEGAWAETWRVLLGIGPSGVVNAGLASEEAAEALGRLPYDAASTAEHYPRLETISGLPTTTGEIALTDCVMFNNLPPIWLTGNLTRTNEADDWVVQSIEVLDPSGGCVPQEVADAAIAGAQAFSNAQPEFWEPADPSHPLVAETTFGDYREFLEGLLSGFAEQGVIAQYDRPAPDYVVIVVESANRIVLQDCYEPGPDYGFFLPNGEHVEGSSPPAAGQTNIEEPLMIREADGDEFNWKVGELNGIIDYGCEPGSVGMQVATH